MARLFDAYVMVDWSAAAKPRRGRDTIWYAIVTRDKGEGWDGTAPTLRALANPPTRAEATETLGAALAEMLGDGRRILAGFDFPFGFPAGTAARLGLRGLPWRNMWQTLDDMLDDDGGNRNNRFDVAERLNEKLAGEAFPFWGNVREEPRPFLLRRGRRPHGPDDLRERRLCDLRLPKTQPVWKLAGVGAVGSQALTGIPRVWQLRRDPRLAFAAQIWPFETGLRFDSRAGLVLAEIYPSMIPAPPLAGHPKDAAQVVAMARHFAALDDTEKLEDYFSIGNALTAGERHGIEREEGWILGTLAT